MALELLTRSSEASFLSCGWVRHFPSSLLKAWRPQLLMDTRMRPRDPTRTAVGKAQGVWRAEAFSRQGFLKEVALELSLKS